MAIHKLFTKILLIQTYHTTCVPFSCEFISTRTLIFILVILSYCLVFYEETDWSMLLTDH